MTGFLIALSYVLIFGDAYRPPFRTADQEGAIRRVLIPACIRFHISIFGIAAPRRRARRRGLAPGRLARAGCPAR